MTRASDAAYREHSRTRSEQRARLARLSPETRYAIKNAIIDWVETAREEGYEPMAGWGNFMVEADHSALLIRVLSGKLPLAKPPSKEHGYPNYEAVEGDG